MSDISERSAEVAHSFRTVVDEVLRPESDRPGFGIYHNPTVDVQTNISFNDADIAFTRHRTGTGQTGYQGLDFVPSHSVELFQRNRFFGMTIGQTVFGVRENNTFSRSHMPNPRGLGLAQVNRDLELHEAEALIEFIVSPHLHAGRLAVAMQFTKAEVESIDEIKRRDKEASDDLNASLKKIDEVRRSGWATLHQDQTLYK